MLSMMRPYRAVAIAIFICLRPFSSGAFGFTASTSTTRGGCTSGGRTRVVVGSTVESEAVVVPNSDRDVDIASSSSSSSSSAAPRSPNWESRQHLYGADISQLENNNDYPSSSSSSGAVSSVTLDANGMELSSGTGGGASSLPLPQTYVTCGKCNSLFAIAEEDLGRGKGCRVKCGVCSHTWYQSRDRLFDIPTDTHDMIPANKSDLDRIARNLARDVSPSFTGVFKLYVGNLDFRTTADQLLEFFENGSSSENARGSVCDVSMVKGPDGRSRGFAFVTFYDEEDGRAALSCNGMECNGRELSVKEPNN